MLLKRKDFSECNIMGNSDASRTSRHAQGRKYLNHDERLRFLAAAAQVDERQRLFAELLAWTGARISEVLAVTALSFDLFASTVTLPTLKRRRHVPREIPIPPQLMHRLDECFALRSSQQDATLAGSRLWSFCRVTGWRIVKHLMDVAGIVGLRATPRGLRHGFGVGTLQAGVPLTLLKRWLGHARLSTTEIYLDVIGPEEIAFAARFWSLGHCAADPPLPG